MTQNDLENILQMLININDIIEKQLDINTKVNNDLVHIQEVHNNLADRYLSLENKVMELEDQIDALIKLTNLPGNTKMH